MKTFAVGRTNKASPRLHTIAAGGVGTLGGASYAGTNGTKPDQYAQYRTEHPLPRRASNAWLMLLVVALVFLCAVLATRKNQPAPTPIAVATPVATPAATPAAAYQPPLVRTVPRAEPVSVPRAAPVLGPLTTAGAPMESGRQYSVSMPDGRQLLINWRGWVDHACNLPKQHGINNAAYTESATGHTWIWTVPEGASNVPRWIDP